MFNIIDTAGCRWESRYVMSRVCLLFDTHHNPPLNQFKWQREHWTDENVLIQNTGNITFAMCVYQEQAKQLLKHARICQQSMRRPIMYEATEQISDHTEWITIDCRRYTTEVKTCNTNVNTGIAFRQQCSWYAQKETAGWNKKQPSVQHFGSPVQCKLKIAEQAHAWPLQQFLLLCDTLMNADYSSVQCFD